MDSNSCRLKLKRRPRSEPMQGAGAMPPTRRVGAHMVALSLVAQLVPSQTKSTRKENGKATLPTSTGAFVTRHAASHRQVALWAWWPSLAAWRQFLISVPPLRRLNYSAVQWDTDGLKKASQCEPGHCEARCGLGCAETDRCSSKRSVTVNCRGTGDA